MVIWEGRAHAVFMEIDDVTNTNAHICDVSMQHDDSSVSPPPTLEVIALLWLLCRSL